MRLALFTPLALLLACGQDPPTLQASAQPTTFPQGGSTTLTVTVTDFELKSPAQAAGLHAALTAAHSDEEHGTGTAYPNSGHYHVYFDTHDQDPIFQGYQTTQAITVHGKAGAHKLIVQLNGEDHKLLDPPVRAEVPITLTSTAG